MILKIIKIGHKTLKKKSKPITTFDENLQDLHVDFLETMLDANGIGLAAPQINIPIQLAVIDISDVEEDGITTLNLNGKNIDKSEIMPLSIINPKITYGKKKSPFEEGCLSIPEIKAPVVRPEFISTEYQDINGKKHILKCDGLLSRAIQHETDHLNGILFIDRLSSAQKIKLRGKIKKITRS